MKTNCLILLCLCCMSSFSQTKDFAPSGERKGYIGISLGPSIPIGKFASTSLTDEDAGFAKTGYNFEINFAYRLGSSVGIAATIRAQRNKYDTDVLLNAFNAYGSLGLFTDLRIEAEDWQASGLLAGLYVTAPIGYSQRTSFDGRLLMGFMNAKYPRVRISYGGDYFEISNSEAITFGFLVGMGFRFNVSDRIGILTNMDILFLEANFRNVEATSSTGASPETQDISQPMSSFNAGVGIAFRLK